MAEQFGVYWVGQDGNVYTKDQYSGVSNIGSADQQLGTSSNSNLLNSRYTQISDPNAPKPSTDSYTDGSGTSAAQAKASSQISYIDQLLAGIGAQRDSGLQRLQSTYDTSKNRLTEDKTSAFAKYGQQRTQNDQNKQRGVEQVDQFANSSNNNLQRLLQSGNSGNSSVGKYLIPQLVSKAAGSRRTGVFNTAGQNASDIAGAENDANTQYNRAFADLDTQRKDQEQSFRQSILDKQNQLDLQKMGLQQDAGIATDATQAALTARNNELNALFGQFQPTIDPQAVNLKTPELGKYTVDPASIRYGQQGPAETSAYLPSLKKKLQGA